jgi:hypothetical protein
MAPSTSTVKRKLTSEPAQRSFRCGKVHYISYSGGMCHWFSNGRTRVIGGTEFANGQAALASTGAAELRPPLSELQTFNPCFVSL